MSPKGRVNPIKKINEEKEMEKLYSIGDVSKLKDVTIKALRYYHKVGILVPRYIDERSGYRYYSLDQFIHLDVIKGCRALGTSIEELQMIFKTCQTDELILFLQQKKKEASQQMIKMQQIMADIDRLTDAVVTSKNLLQELQITVQFLNKRPIIKTQCREVGDLKELISYSELEKLSQELGLVPSLQRGMMYAYNVKGNREPLFVFSEIEGINHHFVVEDYLPEGRYVTMTYHKENEAERLAQMKQYVKDHQLKVKYVIEYDLYHDFFNPKTYGCLMQLLLEE